MPEPAASTIQAEIGLRAGSDCEIGSMGLPTATGRRLITSGNVDRRPF
jgi:hypothetical protein